MKRLVALLLVLSMLGSPVAFAQEPKPTKVDKVSGLVLFAGWAARIGTASTSNEIVRWSPMLWVLFGMVAGITREIQTNPAKYGRYQYSGQPEVAGRENKKWRHSKTSLWNELVDYEAPGPGAEKIPFSTGLNAPIPNTFVPTPD